MNPSRKTATPNLFRIGAWILLTCVFTYPSSTALPAPSASTGNHETSFAQTDMELITPGTFTMGSPLSEPGRLEDEPEHKVQISRAFYMGRTEVTWSQWRQVRDWGVENGYTDLSAGYNGFWGDRVGEDHPVTDISWWDTVYWCNALSEMEGRRPVYYADPDYSADSVIRTGMPKIYADWNADGYRLPSEAEWEYACRAGASTAFHTGDITHGGQECLPDPSADKAGWHCNNSEQNTHIPARKEANAWGLHDMHGNVWEWCWDWYGPYETGGLATDPAGPDIGTARIMRGGSWMNAPRQLRSAHRHALAPATAFYNIGFRVARTKPEEASP